MYANDIRMLYTQLKACLKREFNDYFVRDDTYISYEDKCKEPKTEILEYYYGRNFQRLDEINQELQVATEKRVDDAALTFNYYGWSDKQIRNIALNYNWDELRNNVFVNEALSNESFETWGVKTLGGLHGGNCDRMINEMISEHETSLLKHKTFVPKKTDSHFLQQTDKFWNPADLPI